MLLTETQVEVRRAGMEQSKLEDAITRVFRRKGEAIVAMNIQAFRIGREAGKEQVKFYLLNR